MWELLELSLNKLDVKSEATRALRDRVLDIRERPDLADELLTELRSDKESSNCANCDSRHFCDFFLACIYYELVDLEKMQDHIKDAIKDFYRMGSKWNETFARWVYGQLLLDIGESLAARRELELAIEMFEKIAKKFREEDRYEKRDECFLFTELIKVSLNSKKTKKRPLVRIKINQDYERFETLDKENLRSSLAHTLKISSDQIEIIYVSPGSVNVTLKLSEEGALLLSKMYLTKDRMIEALGIEELKIKAPEDNKKDEIANTQILSESALIPAQTGIDTIRDEITNNPRSGAKALSTFASGKEEFRELQDRIDVLRSSLAHVFEDAQFGWNENNRHDRNKIVGQLLQICSGIQNSELQ